MKVITSGSKFLDIDGYAGCVAYAELMQKLGVDAIAVSTAPLNQSIPQIVRDWPTQLATEYSPAPNDTYVLIDLSNPDYFEQFVSLDRISAIFDHHPGYEAYWRDRIGAGAVIERVGAACTQVFEEWEEAGFIDQISEVSARLLMCGILDNTLNFGADITTERDKHAYETLCKYANLPENWPAVYFGACQEGILDDVSQSIKNDIKVTTFKTIPHTIAIGQLAVWEPTGVVQQPFDIFKQTLGVAQSYWFMNIIGIHEHKSYFVTDVPVVQEWLSDLLGVQFDGFLAVADRTWLRKEIAHADIDRSTQIN